MDTLQNYKEIEVENTNDIELSKPSKSRFLFVLFFLGFFIFAWSGCYKLYENKFQKNDDVKVPGSTLYEPKYK
jgi:hypothetical protein